MRSVLSATLMVAAALWGTSALAQMTTPPSTAGTKPKPVTTIPIRPALQKPEETANAMAQAERLALQIRQRHDVVIDHAERADTGGGEIHQHGRT